MSPVSCSVQWKQFSATFTHSTLPSKYIQSLIAWNSVSRSLRSMLCTPCILVKMIILLSAVPFFSSASLYPQIRQLPASPIYTHHIPPSRSRALASTSRKPYLIHQSEGPCLWSPRYQPYIAVTDTSSLSESVSIYGSQEGASLTDIGY